MENYKLLVVDDAFFIRNLIKKAISNKPKNENFSISVIGEAKNAKEALEFCENENPDIITVDYQMPPGENGVQLIKELKQKYPNKIFLMISDELNIEKEVLSLGCKFLVKPFREDVLWDRLDQAILAHLKEQLNNKQIITDNDKTVEKKIEKVKPITETVSNENKKEDTHMDDKSEIIQPTKKKKKKKKKKNPKSELELEFGFEIAGSLKKEPNEPNEPNELKEPKKKSMSKSINQLSKDNEKNQEVEAKTDVETEKNTKIEAVNEFPKQLDSNVENNLEPKIKPEIENKENLNTNSIKDNNEIISKNEKAKEQKELEIQKEEEDDCLSLDFANISIDEKTEKLIDDKEEQTSKEIVDTKDINQKEEDLNDEILIDSESDENPLFDEDYISKNESEKIEEKETEIVDTDTDTDNDDPYYIDDDDDVFTFYEEDESEYEDKDIDKFQADSVEPKSIVDESEELTEDQELEALIKEASYSIDDETKVIPERTKKYKLILDDDPDIFVSEDTQTDMESFNNSYESETKDFDSMLEDFEKSDDFKKAEADVDQFDLFEQNLNQIDENNFELDEEDEKDEEDESSSEDSMLFTESNNHVKLDNIETSNDMIHTNTDDFHLDKNEEINEDDFEFADDFYLDEDELPNNNSQLDESNVMDEDDYEIFDLDEDFDKDADFNLDTPIKNEESITSHVKEKVPTKQNNDTEKDFDSYFEMADNTDYETMPIYDTQELPTSEIIKRNQEYLRQKQNNDIMPPQQEHQKSIQIKEGRPDGTNVKQKDSFFGRFFKKK